MQYFEMPPAETSAPEGAAAGEIDARPPTELSLDAAREHLDLTDLPWLFFQDSDSGRGEVLYRRYDGHYGLVVPAAGD